METNEQQFITGFNNGYLLAKHEPKLLNKIAKTIEPVNDYLSGFISGKEEYELEYMNTQLKNLSQLRNHQQGKDINLDLS